MHSIIFNYFPDPLCHCDCLILYRLCFVPAHQCSSVSVCFTATSKLSTYTSDDAPLIKVDALSNTTVISVEVSPLLLANLSHKSWGLSGCSCETISSKLLND